MTRHPTRLRPAALIALLASVALPAVAQDRVGVAAAVNTASTLERGTGQRTVVIGNDIAFRDRIITSPSGLVQVLFVDGSAFTVGANSRVVIDEFAYNPSTGAGALAAEVTRGALRFVGGGVSKGDNPVRLRTPVGTLGVRGGIAEVDTTPPCQSDGRCPRLVATLVFGRDLTLALPNGQTRRIWERGNAFVVYDAPGGSLPLVEIVPLRLLDLGGLQARLAGRPGQRGGAPAGPTDAAVTQSGVPAANSARAPSVVRPRPRREVVATALAPDEDVPGIGTTQQVLAQTISEIAQADAIRQAVTDGGEEEPIDPSRITPSGVFGSPPEGLFTRNGSGIFVDAPPVTNLVSRDTDGLLPASVIQDSAGRPVAVEIADVTLTLPPAQGVTPIPSTQTSFGQVRGHILRGPGDFSLIHLTEDSFEDATTGVAYVLLGPPTPRDVFYPAAGTRPAEVRTYAFGPEFHLRERGISDRVPLLNPLAAEAFGAAALAAAAVTPFYTIERASVTPSTTTLHAAMLIDGLGLYQQSMIVSDAGIVFSSLASSGGAAVGIGGTRRGSYRLGADFPAVFMRGGTGSARIENPALFTAVVGPGGEAFVYSSMLTGGGLARNAEGREFEFVDVARGDPLRTPASPVQYSSVFVPAFLESTVPAAGFDVPSGTVSGFAAGMVEPQFGAPRPYRGFLPGDFSLTFNASNRLIGGEIAVTNAGDEYDAAQFRYGFGFDVTGLFPSATNGRSALLDRTRYAANSTGPGNAQGGDSTLLITDAGDVIQHQPWNGGATPGADPGTYVVSAGLVPQPQLFAASDVTPCACTFMHWGWWGTQTEFVSPLLSGGVRRDMVHLGTWAAADLPTLDALPDFGTGSYAGHAIGTVAELVGDSIAQHVAVGAMTFDYDFADRSGFLEISGFAGRDFSGEMGGFDAGFNAFAGPLDGAGLIGTASGAFARGPDGPAQGVLGAFDLTGPGFAATGTFMGERIVPGGL